MKTAIVIPVRLNSGRLPRKLLEDIGDSKTVLNAVVDAALLADKCHNVIIAVSVNCIEDAMLKSALHRYDFGARLKFMPTHADHPNGTSRCAEIALHTDAELYINLQADECEIDPHTLDKFITFMHRLPASSVGTIASNINNAHHGCVRVALDNQGKTLYFSRCDLPGSFAHVGVYGYCAQTLLQISRLREEQVAFAEKLEQLNWIGLYPTYAMMTDKVFHSVNDAASLEEVRKRRKR